MKLYEIVCGNNVQYAVFGATICAGILLNAEFSNVGAGTLYSRICMYVLVLLGQLTRHVCWFKFSIFCIIPYLYVCVGIWYLVFGT